MREIRPSGLTRGGEANLPAYSTHSFCSTARLAWHVALSFLSFYRAAGLAWICGGRWPASFPLFYRAVGLGPDLFDFSPQLDERRRAASPARTKELLKKHAAR